MYDSFDAMLIVGLGTLSVIGVVMAVFAILKSMSETARAKVVTEFWYAVHNLIAHPLLVVTWWLSLGGRVRVILRIGNWFHAVTA